MTHHPYIERVAHLLAAAALGAALLIGIPMLDEISRQPAEPPAPPAPPSTRVEEGALIARIRVDRLSLDAPVFEGVESRTLASGAGHLPGTALPGEEGPLQHSVIAVARDARPAVLADLRLGDRVQMQTPFGLKRYRVRERSIVEPEGVRLGPTRHPRVTFVTAYPVDSIGPAPLRLAVVLEPAAEEGGRGAPGEPRIAAAVLRAGAPFRRGPVAVAQAPIAWRNSETRVTGRADTSVNPDASDAFPAGR
jgi:sortase A